MASLIVVPAPDPEDAPRSLQQTSSDALSRESTTGSRVTLHIYDVGALPILQKVNDIFRNAGTGAFHAGVEVYGQEWSFGYRDNSSSGVYCCRPKENVQHVYRESTFMGATCLSVAEVQSILVHLGLDWQGCKYDLLTRNCCHFSDALCQALGVGPAPEWVTNLASTGASLLVGVDQAVSRAQAAVDVAAAKAGELDTWLQLSDSVEAFSTREISVDETYIAARAQDMWSQAVEQVASIADLFTIDKVWGHAFAKGDKALPSPQEAHPPSTCANPTEGQDGDEMFFPLGEESDAIASEAPYPSLPAVASPPVRKVSKTLHVEPRPAVSNNDMVIFV